MRGGPWRGSHLQLADLGSPADMDRACEDRECGTSTATSTSTSTGIRRHARGHAHPAVVAAVSERVRKGTHFAQPTADAIDVAEELTRRYGMTMWRFGNSGTEATMDAVHLMRAITGRDLIIKFEGGYHGHHDSVMVSVWNEDDLGPESRPASMPAGSGIPSAIVDLTLVATFNDLDVVSQLLDENEGRVAGVIVEPILQNCGILLPQPGFLQGLRELTREHDALLTFDEVKTGLTVGKGEPPVASASSPTSSAWPSRSAAVFPSRQSAEPTK